MARNPGRFIEVKEGVHKGKRGFMYNKEQTPELIKQKKALVWLPSEVSQGDFFDVPKQTDCKQTLVSFDLLKVIGFID